MFTQSEAARSMRTQDIPEMRQCEFFELDPDYVSQPEGLMKMTKSTFWALVSLRVYLIAMLALSSYRFAQLAHWIK